MEYNKFLRLYYEKMLDIFQNVDFNPNIEVNLDENHFSVPSRYLEKNTKNCPFLGLLKVKLGSPNSAYEMYFDTMNKSYPELFMLFLPKEDLTRTSSELNSLDDITNYLKAVYLLFLNAGFITENNKGMEA